MEFDMIVRNGIIANANDVVFGQEIGVKDGLIACIGSNLPSSPSTTIIDAKGGYITPGGVDSHVHLEQPDLRQDSDTWETGTRSAVCGGTTTVLAFAVQQKTDKSIVPLVQDYSTLARGNAACDYGFHIILSNPTKHVLETELPAIAKGLGITSVKLYMTYDAMKVDDRGILDVLIATRRLGVTTMIHAENHDMVSLITETLERDGQTDPYFHAVSRPKIAEDEASYRAIALSELMDTPILLVHVSSETTASHIRRAQSRLLPVYGETCPQYLYLLSENLRGEEFQGAKCVCSPPVRESPEDLRAMWTAIANGTFTTYSSDHCATKFNASGGKRLGLVNGIPKFSKIPNGLPGLETRQPLLFKGVLDGKISIQDFVRVSCTNPAQLYGLPTKGVIFPGKDADLCIWYPKGEMQPLQLTNAMLHHAIDYSPFEGMTFYNWPRYTILGGKVVWDRDNGGYVGKRGDGNYLKRESSMLRGPRNVFVNEWKPPAEVFEQSTRASKCSSCLDCSIQL